MVWRADAARLCTGGRDAAASHSITATLQTKAQSPLLNHTTSAVVPATSTITPERDRSHLRALLQKKFPAVPIDEWSQGSLALSPGLAVTPLGAANATNVNDVIAIGKKQWERKFANSKSLSDCFAMPKSREPRALAPQRTSTNTSTSTAQTSAPSLLSTAAYPIVDTQTGIVVTLEMAIRLCFERNAEPSPAGSDTLIWGSLVAYARSIHAGQKLNMHITTPVARERYLAGRAWVSRRMGERDLACISCHVLSAGEVVDGMTLSPAIGQVMAWPRVEPGGEIRRLHQQFQRCMTRMGAEPFANGAIAFNEIEYFLSSLSHGLTIRPPIPAQ